MNGLYIIPILAFLILIHEVGHYVTARMVGVKVEEFGIGIPPRLFGWTRNGVIWSINAIPFGGFVRVKGEDGANMDADSMNSKGPWQRAYFLAAGSFMNLVTAIVLIVLLIGIRGVTTENLYVDYVEPNSPAAAAGWQTGDKIIEAGGHDIDNQQELSNVTDDFNDRPMNVVLLRGTERIDTMVTPRSDPPEGQGATGIRVSGGDIPDANVEVSTLIPEQCRGCRRPAGRRRVRLDRWPPNRGRLLRPGGRTQLRGPDRSGRGPRHRRPDSTTGSGDPAGRNRADRSGVRFTGRRSRMAA